jgi:sugar phosphate isomerase/epimerase
MRAEGVDVISVAADLAESTFAACASSGVPLIRIMAGLGPDGYAASVARVRKQLEEAAPLAERYGVQVGVQPHHGRFVSSALGVARGTSRSVIRAPTTVGAPASTSRGAPPPC